MTISRLIPPAVVAALPTAALLLGLAIPHVPAFAGPGHDHGDEASAVEGPALPRFYAVSEAFELVGVLNGKQLTLYLDDAATNAPVKEAELQVEFGNEKLKLEPHEEGEFVAMLAQAPAEGAIPIAATVVAGNETDLLAGELDIHDEHAGADEHAEDWTQYALWAVGGLVALILAVAVVRRQRRNKRSGGAA